MLYPYIAHPTLTGFETFHAICQGNYTLNRLIRTQVYEPLSPVDDENYNRWRSISGNNYYILDEEEKEMKRENSLEGVVNQILLEL